MSALQDAERKLAIAESVLSAARASQVHEREAAEAAIAKAQRQLQSLDCAIAPYVEAADSVRVLVAAATKKLVGPWQVTSARGVPDGTLKMASHSAEWWATVAWLRVVSRDKRRWECYFGNCVENQDIDFGPLSDDPIADFERHRVAVEEKLRSLGFTILTTEEAEKRFVTSAAAENTRR